MLLCSAGLTLCLFIVALLLLTPRGENSGKPWLALAFIESAFFLTTMIVEYNNITGLLLHALKTLDGLYAIPTVYLFTRTILIQPDPRPLRHFVPFIVFLSASFIIAFLPKGLNLIEISSLDEISWYVETFQIIWYGRLSLALVIEPRRKDTRTVQAIRVARWLLLGFAVFTMGLWLRDLFDYAGIMPAVLDEAPWVETFLTFPFCLIAGFILTTQPDLLFGTGPIDRRPKFNGGFLSRERAEELLARARAWLRSRKNLAEATPRSLAEAIAIPYHELSRASNEFGQKTLGDLINEIKVERVCLLLQERSELDILDSAFEAGFVAKSSFNEIFKREKGMSPREWRKSRLH